MQLSSPHGWRGWLWPAMLATVIVIASGRQVAAPHVVNFDKAAHFFIFGLLATLVARNGFVPGRAWVAIAIVSLFGLTDEWHQSFTPGRSVEVADWLADTLGATLAVTVYAASPLYRATLEQGLTSRRRRS
jgi:VanZ family protein